ncbi:hypothetical protein MLD38_008109 [Melastoma candidum]|uniref:Uncharacterized protein n=1 Tax=Melastoma candidum TaxID=119954 RepID=A0ACB9RT86_9MYRT|nr:hypothetical protein MLD38_008109 [Melastoma candidum]
MHKLRDELKASLSNMDMLPSLSNWHVMELLYNCLPERITHNHTDVCVLRSMKEEMLNLIAPLATRPITRGHSSHSWVAPMFCFARQQHVSPPLLPLRAPVLHHAEA